MHDSAEDRKRLRGHQQDKAVLKYLRGMISYCRRNNHREMRWYYEAGWELATAKLYGPLPPRPQYNVKGLEVSPEPPEQVVTRWLPGTIRPATREMPLRKIVKRFTRSHNGFEYTYETLECAHIVHGPVGYSVPVKSRRCPHCAIVAMAKKRKPASRVDEVEQTKAVGA